MIAVGFALAVAASLLWGVAYSIDQGILKKYAPGTIMLICSVTSLTINSFLADRKELVEISRDLKSFFLIVFTAVIGAIAGRLTLHSIQMIGAARSSIVEITYPVFVCVFCYIFYRETLDYKFVIGATLILIGTIVVMQSSIK